MRVWRWSIWRCLFSVDALIILVQTRIRLCRAGYCAVLYNIGLNAIRACILQHVLVVPVPVACGLTFVI